VTKHRYLNQASPDAWEALLALDKAAVTTAVETGLSPLLLELVKIRCSQINGCAYCLRMHMQDAASLGETANRLAVVSAWRDTEYFSPQERAALAVAERTTLLSNRVSGAADDVSALEPDQISAVEWAAVAINAFNRVAVLSHYEVR
jgi:AhpD family alkylhydroperoxidase